jgi:hypothetical protein
MWQAKGGGRVDGVISTDPVALSDVLGGTGPIRLAGGQRLSADNAVSQLLNQAYFKISNPDQQNAYFASVAKRAFDAFSSGQGQPAAVLKGVVHSVEARRILIWSDRSQEQAILQPTALSGALPRKSDGSPHVGVYLNDNTAAKMDYYLHYQVSAKSTSCQDGRQHLTVTMNMKNTAPKNVSSLPPYVTGSVPGIPRGTARTTVYAFAPVAGSASSATLDGAKQPLSRFQLDGRRLVAQTIDVAPGQSRQISYQMVSGPGQTGPLNLRVTPGAHGSGVGSIGPNACS